MISGPISKHVERLLLAGFLCACLGSYFGNVFVAVGHGLLVIALGLALWAGFCGGKQGQVGHGTPVRGSTWFLLAMAMVIVLSVVANWSMIENPGGVLKRVRYHLIWASLILVPSLRILSGEVMDRWAPWLLAAWLFSLSAATISGLVGLMTGYNPLLLAPDAYPTRASGVSSMVMTYAYSLQFSLLLLVGLTVSRNDILAWVGRGRPWLRWWVFAALGLAMVALYLSLTRGALAGAMVGGLCLVVMLKQRWMLISVAAVGLIVVSVALTQENRYVSIEALKADSVRLSQWKTAWAVFQEKPWWGIGYRQFEERCVELKIQYGMPFDHVSPSGKRMIPVHFRGHAHNEMLEALATTGLVGGLAFLGFFGCWTWEVTRSRRARLLFVPIIVAFMVSGMVQNMLTDSEVLNFILFLYVISQFLLDAESGNGAAGERAPEVGQGASRTM